MCCMDKDISTTLRAAVYDSILEKCIKPIIAILNLVPNIDIKVKERKTILLDFDFYKEKLQSMHTQLANNTSKMRLSTGVGSQAEIADSYQVNVVCVCNI